MSDPMSDIENRNAPGLRWITLLIGRPSKDAGLATSGRHKGFPTSRRHEGG